MISYKPLRHLLIDADIKMQQLKIDGILSPNMAVKINNDEGYVNLSTIDKLGHYFSKKLQRPVTISELIKFIPDQQQTNE